jgi:hypothetical protein
MEADPSSRKQAVAMGYELGLRTGKPIVFHVVVHLIPSAELIWAPTVFDMTADSYVARREGQPGRNM